MGHVKSNAWTPASLEQRLQTDLPGLAGFHTRLFLDVYWPIHHAWQQRLADDGSIDFEDMLTQAADHLESGRLESLYQLVLVDEFQDASRARTGGRGGFVSPGSGAVTPLTLGRSHDRSCGQLLSQLGNGHVRNRGEPGVR